MKTLFITLSLLFAAVAGTVYAANEKDPQVSEVRKVEAFSSVKVTSVATVYFTQSDGDNNRNKGVTIYLSAPDLKDVEFTGVGSFNCEGALKLNDVKFEIEGVGKVNVKDLTCKSLVVKMEGVGKADIHVDCDRLRASMEGVGSVTLSGRARQADISKGGIGGVNTRNLKIGE
jgi:hypothetical protein